MKLKLSLVLCALSFAIAAESQVLRPFTPRFSNPSVRGNIVYVSNNIITTTATSTTDAPPGGNATNNDNPAAYIDIDGIPATEYLAWGSSWYYRAGNTRPANWHTTGYDHSAWTTGLGEFGYGSGDETTCIPSGGGGTVCNPTGTKWITTYFRKVVNIADPSVHSDFTMNVKRDDGIAVYVNGVEVYRNNLPAGALAHGTLATNATDNGNAVLSVTLPSTTFVAGNNTIAVEIHQTNATSSDLSFNMQLLGNPNDHTTFIQYQSNWKYLANNTRPSNWETPSFNDAAWPAGNGHFGYGDGDETTCIPSGGGGTVCSPTGDKWITTYFRKTINIPNPNDFSSFRIDLVRDDGAVVYVNGVEVLRSNMPAGVITHATVASSNISGSAESTPVPYHIPASYFVAGDNTIAVEIHQDVITSTDISFDMQLQGSSDSTICSSSADLNLPSCVNVLWAGLYWGATQGSDGNNTSWINNETNVDIMVPGTTNYQTVVSAQTDYHNGTLVPGLPHTGYRCFADITSLINTNNPNGTYTIANVVGPAGIENGSGGWTIVIAYADPSTVVRNLTVFDGSVIMNGGDPALHVPITGFLTPPAGPVSCELGAVVFDGDRDQTDEFSFKQNSNPLVGTFTNMTPNTTADLNDMWNSTISYKGAVVTTRVPAHQNTLGYDADIIDVPNASNAVLGNSQTSASIRFSSPSENYMLQVVSTAISQFTPEFNISKSSTDINGGALLPGDDLLYTVSYRNGGNDASTETVLTDRIPTGTSYKPGTLRIDGIAKTDAAGDDEAEYDYITNTVTFRIGTGANATNGGEMTPSASGEASFEVYTATSCAVLTCSSSVSNQARISYNGKLSTLNLYDSSGVVVSGCIVPGPVVNTVLGSCDPVGDMILTNICPSVTVTLPYEQYAGYRFYTAMPFTDATLYDPFVPVNFTRTIYAFFDGAGSCDDTIRLNIYITACPDIDDDDDGIPDYIEINNPAATQDHDSDGVPNWSDINYPGYVDNNADGFNDNFDPSADSDNDGIPNYRDNNFPGYVDTNSDGVNDNMDKDLDGIPNHLDLDSDNDGIPDTVESFGVDANGDGRIDNYSDTDNDGLSQNVDAGSGGVIGSGQGLGAVDTDGDGIPNYLDLDSDNDGIPDIAEVFGPDLDNDGRIDGFTDDDFDGLSDNVDGDTDNDGIAENAANSLVLTGTDVDNNGRADSYPYKNMDADSRINPYDLDSDMDGITDTREAGFADADWNGRIDGTYNADGWSNVVAAMPSLNLPNTDGTGRINVYDIDSDDDGIPDNIEGQTTPGYLLPSGNDTDGDGIDNTYDDFNGFGGDGIHVYDEDGDGIPDYLDSDTDNDGTPDIVEGNDFNHNNIQDDNITLTGVDTDGDGLDDRFDNDNSSAKGTSAYMGNGGTTIGDASPGSITVVQHTPVPGDGGCPTERDWRCLSYVLNCQVISFSANLQDEQVRLDWSTLCAQEADHFIVLRSTDKLSFTEVERVPGKKGVNEINTYRATDDLSSINAGIVYYRLQSVLENGKIQLSNIVSVRREAENSPTVQVFPNPVNDHLQVAVRSAGTLKVQVRIVAANGHTLKSYNERLLPGYNVLTFNETRSLPNGIYYLQLNLGDQLITRKFSILK